MSLMEYIREYRQEHPRITPPAEKLAGEIREGIAKTGCYILDDFELGDVWAGRELSPGEKRDALQRFAAQHGLGLYLTPHQKVAVFTRAE